MGAAVYLLHEDFVVLEVRAQKPFIPGNPARALLIDLRPSSSGMTSWDQSPFVLGDHFDSCSVSLPAEPTAAALGCRCRW